MTKVLGLAGKAGAGKDSVYRALDDEGLGVVERVAFADDVKNDIEEALGLLPHDSILWDKPYTPEVRWLLQQWGTELRRAQDPDYWVRKGAEAITEASTYADLVVVTDVRFQNEVDAIHEAGGIVAEVYAHDAIRAGRLGVSEELLKVQDRHASAIIDFKTDGVIINNETPKYAPVIAEFLGLSG